MAAYCYSCLRKAKGKVGAKCPCGAEWRHCKNVKARAAAVTRLRNLREGKARSPRAAYAAYLAGDLWIGIRQSILSRDGGKCQCCGKQAKVVHHRNYNSATLAGESPESLISLCKKCHKDVHRSDSGRRHGIKDTETKLVKLLSAIC